MTDRHLDTSAGVLRFCELRRREMAEQFMKDGRFEVRGHSFGGYVFATHAIRVPKDRGGPIDAWKVGPKLDHVEAIPIYLPEWCDAVMEARQLTSFWAMAIKSYVKLTRAIGTLIMSETWQVQTPPGVAARVSAQEYRDTLPDSLEDADNRRESLMVLLEHSATGRRNWMSEIKRSPTRLEPWASPDYGDMEGRLVNLSGYAS